MQYSWNGNNGSYTDATQWTPEGIPLYGSSDSALIESGTVILSNTAPNNVTVTLAGLSAETQPNLVLDNAAIGPSAQLILVPTAFTGDGYSTLTIQGYDTNYGTIDVSDTNFSETATIAIAPYSQLNQEGTINVGTSRQALQITRSSDAPATLNNDGDINIRGGRAIISADVIGSGTINFIAGDVELGGGVSSDQHISFSPSAFLRIDDPSAFHGIIDGFSDAGASITLANTQATGAFFAQITPDSGALLILNGLEVVDALTVTGAHASDAYRASSGPVGSITYIKPV